MAYTIGAHTDTDSNIDTDIAFIEQCRIHKMVKDSGYHNFEKCKIPLQTNLNIAKWEEYLSQYSYCDKIVVQYLAFGWPLNFVSETPPRSELRNHKGARDFSAFVDGYLKREVKNGRILGPFIRPPFENFAVSPLNTVPKSDSDERRVIVDLSWPIGSSVNDGIDGELYLGEPSDLHFPTIDDIVTLIHQAGAGCFIYKRDLKTAYRQFPVDPGDWQYLGYFWNGRYYFDTTLCMGQKTSALGCQRSTRAVVFIHTCRGYSCTVYLDDFIGIEPISRAWASYYDLLKLMVELGLRENAVKAHPPSQRQVCLGILFDTVNMTISVTDERLTEIRELLAVWSDKSVASKREIQALLGKLMFVSKCVRQSRIFVNRILTVLRSLKRDFYKYKLSIDFKRDLVWWRTFISVYNGVSILPGDRWSAPDAVLATDACLTGCGAICGKSYFHSEFPEVIKLQELHIHNLELLTVVVALRLWHNELAGNRVLIYCDNSPSVFALNSGRTSDSFSASCLRELWFWCCMSQVEIRAVHLPGRENRLPDFLSRWHLDIKYQKLFFNEIDSNVFDDVLLHNELFIFHDQF